MSVKVEVGDGVSVGEGVIEGKGVQVGELVGVAVGVMVGVGERGVLVRVGVGSFSMRGKRNFHPQKRVRAIKSKIRPIIKKRVVLTFIGYEYIFPLFRYPILEKPPIRPPELAFNQLMGQLTEKLSLKVVKILAIFKVFVYTVGRKWFKVVRNGLLRRVTGGLCLKRC